MSIPTDDVDANGSEFLDPADLTSEEWHRKTHGAVLGLGVRMSHLESGLVDVRRDVRALRRWSWSKRLIGAGITLVVIVLASLLCHWLGITPIGG